jgi:hypothetical protein
MGVYIGMDGMDGVELLEIRIYRDGMGTGLKWIGMKLNFDQLVLFLVSVVTCYANVKSLILKRPCLNQSMCEECLNLVALTLVLPWHSTRLPTVHGRFASFLYRGFLGLYSRLNGFKDSAKFGKQL